MTASMTPNCLDQRSRICPSGCFLTALSRSRAGRARFAEISRVLRISPRTASVSAAWTIATPRKAIHLRRVPMSRGFILVQRESLHRIHPLPHLTPREELFTVVCIPERHRRSIAKDVLTLATVLMRTTACCHGGSLAYLVTTVDRQGSRGIACLLAAVANACYPRSR